MAGSKRGSKRRMVEGSHPRPAGKDAVPVIYQEMLADAGSSSPSRFNEEGKPFKRRRIGGRVISRPNGDTSGQETEHSTVLAEDTDTDGANFETALQRQQTTYNDSDNSMNSDMDWEEVDLVKNRARDSAEEDEKPMDLVIGGKDLNAPNRHTSRRKADSMVEKKMRLEVHKTHLLCLLAHVHHRNHWCYDVQVQAATKKVLTKRTISYLNPNSEQSQFQRSRSFMDGLAQATEAWRAKFKITARGMRRPYWAENAEDLKDFSLPDDMDPMLEKPDFRALAVKLEGSRDVGAQLFCAFLRSAGIDARLVCSLQPLPFNATVKTITPQKPKPDRIVEEMSSRPGTSDEDSGVDVQHDVNPFGPTPSGNTNSPAPLVPTRSRRLGQPTFALENEATVPKALPLKCALPPSDNSPPSDKWNIVPKRKRIKESPYPVFWVEAFNAAVQKWVPVDPLVTNTIAKPFKFEPPASNVENNMSYVIAFEEDGTARDVTRRYVKAYNAKTRRFRIESTKGGERWWRRTMRVFNRRWELDRDQVEDAELAAKEAAEEMPRNVQDFKDHPYYALERHLKRNEALHPKREVGKIGAGKSLAGTPSKALEPIYRRRDVHYVKSADGWYRLGREIKAGEQPLKYVQPRRQRAVSAHESGGEDSDGDGAAGTGLYAAFQTVPYVAPPIVNGRVPKNAYGNLDIYVPSMVPRGGVHLPYPEAARAAKIIGVDYADAVTGFEFKGRHGTAVVKGIIAAAESREALEEVIRAFQDERAEAEEARRSAEALRMWRRFMAGLRVRERIDGYEIEGERDAVHEEMENVDEVVDENDGGGFLPDRDEEVTAEPTVGRFGFHQSHAQEEDDGGGFMPGDDNEDADAEEALRSMQVAPKPYTKCEDTLSSRPEHGGGGFMLDEGPYDGGGFTLDDNDQSKSSTIPSNTGTYDSDIREPFVDSELAEAITLQRLHDEGNITLDDASEGGGFILEEDPAQTTPSASVRADNSAIGRKIGHDKPAEKQTDMNIIEHELPRDHQSSKHEQRSEEEEEDRGSLLSHDPEDEDADPEWLASD